MPSLTDAQIVQAYRNLGNLRKTAKHFHIAEQRVVETLKNAGIVYVPWRKHRFNEAFFDTIDTEEKAYFLGFLWSDGCNTKRGEIVLRLVADDRAVLERLSNCIGSTRPLYYCKGRQIVGKQGQIYQSRPSLGLLLSSVRMSRRLAEMGMIPNKTWTLRAPISFVPKPLWGHFMRGCFDGDGSIIRTLVPGHTKKGYIVEYNAKNLAFAEDIRRMVQETIGIPLKLLPAGSIFKLRLSTHATKMSFLDWLYKDATIYLDRKYERYLEARAAKEDWDKQRTSKTKGVYLHGYSGKWRACEYVEGRQVQVGAFRTEAEAVECILRYRAARAAA